MGDGAQRVLIAWMAWSAVAGERLSVDLTGGGLYFAAAVLSARHGVSVNYEGVPRVVEGAGWVRLSDSSREAVSWPLAFDYPSEATPKEAAQAAVVAWNAKPGVDGHYRVLEADDVLHFVPYEVLTDARVYVPYTPLLDTIVPLDGTTRFQRDVYSLLHASVRVVVSSELNGNSGPLVTLPAVDETARALLDRLARGQHSHGWWSLVWSVDAFPGTDDHWAVAFHVPRPSDDGPPFNRAPMVAPPP